MMDSKLAPDPLKGVDGGMVERAARALHAENRRLWPGDLGCGPSFDEDTDFHRHVCRKSARVVITAMREPTEAMLQAGYLEFDHHRNQYATYRDMIDEALK